MVSLYTAPLCVLILLLAVKFLPRSGKQHRKLPPSPPGLPVIGHFHLLKQPIHRTLHNLSQKYGPIISLRLGSRLVVVVSSPSAAEECFTKNDIVLCNRPRFRVGKYLNYNYTTLVVANFGDHWRNLRRLCTNEILSPTRLNAFSRIRRDEVKSLLERLCRVSSHGFVNVNISPMLLDVASNIIMRMVAGKRYRGEDEVSEEARKFQEIVEKTIEYSGTMHLGDFFPILQCVDYDGFERKLSAFGEKTDVFLQHLVDKHRVDKCGNTMVDHLLALQEMQPEYYTDEIIKGLILVMVIAGTETTAKSIDWALTNLLNHLRVLKKAKEELDTTVGHDRLLEESDLSKLNYLRCIIYETLRLHPTAPLLARREASDDCELGGYHVPRGTMVFVNAGAIQRDPNLWDDPNSFKPDRFEDGKGEPYSFMPFGMGRRMCPGQGLADRALGLTLGSLIQCFEWSRISEREINITERTGTLTCKLEPLVVSCKARPNLQKSLLTFVHYENKE